MKIYSWNEAKEKVKELNNKKYLGYNDWRLPTLTELQSLITYNKTKNASLLETQGFSNIQASYYWSSTTYAYYTSSVWIVSMFNGYTELNNKTGYNYVWVIRGEPKTDNFGNFICNNTNERFIDINDGTILDNKTNLYWMKDLSIPDENLKKFCSYCGHKL